jgi:hypothetical protein
MAIIYTYPEKNNVDGSELLLISDGTDENNTKVISTAEYGSYIQATYGGGGPASTIYLSDGSLDSNRYLSGFLGKYLLQFNDLREFEVRTNTNLGGSGDIKLTPAPGTSCVKIGDGSDLCFEGNGDGITGGSSIDNKTYYDSSDLIIKAGRNVSIEATDTNGGVTISNGSNSSGLRISNGVVSLSGSNNDTDDVANDPKNLTTVEYLEFYIGNAGSFTGNTNIDTVGTISTGTWNGDEIGLTYGGTGRSSGDPAYVNGDTLFYDASSPTKFSKLAIGNTGEVLTVSGGSPSWQPISGSSLTNVTTTYTVLSTDETVNCTSASGFTVNLTTAVGETGRKIIIKNSGTGDILVDADAAETIDGALTATLVQYESITVQSDGANWIII